MNGIEKLLAAFAALGLVSGLAQPAAANIPIARTSVAAAQSFGRLQVAGVPRSTFGARDFGRRSAQALVTATVTLRYNREAELDALVRAQSDSSSPLYRHYLTNEQFNGYFAPTPRQEAFVIATLQAAGFRITQTFPNRTLLDVASTSAVAEAFFKTEIHSISQGRYGSRFANVTPLSVPASVAALIGTVGLSNLVIATTGPRPLARNAYPAATPAGDVASPEVATPAATSSPAACKATKISGPLNGDGTLATGVADAFDYPVQHGCNGTGETVGVEISSPVSSTDIKAYLKAAKVTQTGSIAEVAVDGGGTYGGAGSGDTDEASLDVETIAGLAPGIKIRVYNFPDLSDQHIEDGYNKAVSENLVSATNSSFGGCEADDTSFASSTNSIAKQAASKGITFVASSGDSGSDECGTGNDPPLPSAPAGDPYFVAVGGVNFTENGSGKLTSLTAQGDVSGSGFQSGGGVSNFFALPSYQSGSRASRRGAATVRTSRYRASALPSTSAAKSVNSTERRGLRRASWRCSEKRAKSTKRVSDS